MDEYAAFWWGRGAVPTVAPYSHPIQEVPTDANALQPSWLERTERSARACRAWVALAGDFIGLLFRVLVFGATAWVMWTGISVVGEARSALQTEEGARYAGRAVDAFLSALSAPALAALGAGAAALLATVVYVLCGDFGRPRVPAPAAAPLVQPGGVPWGPAWGWPGPECWWPQRPGGAADPRFQALPRAAGGGLELEDGRQVVALAQPRRRGLGRSHTVALLAFCCVAGVPVGAGGTLLGHQGKPGAAEDLLNATRSSGAPAAGKTWSYQNGTGLGGDRAVGGFAACPAFRCGAWVLLQAAAGGVGLPGLPAAAAGWVALETLRPAVRCVGQALLAGLHPSNLRLLSRPAPGAAPETLLCLPLSRSLA